MEKKRLIIISSIGIGIVLLLTIVGIFIYQFFVNKGHVKEFDVDFIHQQAIPYDNLFRVKCDNVDEVKAGDELVCNVSISPDLQNYSIMDDVLEYISFDYELGEFLSLEDISIQSPYNNEIYNQFVFDTSEEKRVILKNNNQHDFHKSVVCDDNGGCRIYGRTFFNVNESNKDIYYDSVSNVMFQFKIKVSDKATYLDPLKIRVHDLYIYACLYGRNEEEDIKTVYKMDELIYEFSANKLKTDESSKSLYQVKVLADDGAPIYVDYNEKFLEHIEAVSQEENSEDNI